MKVNYPVTISRSEGEAREFENALGAAEARQLERARELLSAAIQRLATRQFEDAAHFVELAKLHVENCAIAISDGGATYAPAPHHSA